MPIIGVSKLFQERKAAQLYIYRKMQEKIPGLKVSGGSIMRHEEEMGMANRNNGMDGYLKISEHKLCEDSEYGTCIAFMRLNPNDHAWYFKLPWGCGPYEHPDKTNPSSILYDKKNWRVIFQEKFMLLIDTVMNPLERYRNNPTPDSYVYKKELLAQGLLDPMFKTLLCCTDRNQNLYYIDMFGLKRRAFVWEHVRSIWNGEEVPLVNKENEDERHPDKYIDLRTGQVVGIEDNILSVEELRSLYDFTILRTMTSVEWDRCYKKREQLSWENYFQKLFAYYETDFGNQKFAVLQLTEKPEDWFYHWLTYSREFNSEDGKALLQKLKKENIKLLISSEQGALDHTLWIG